MPILKILPLAALGVLAVAGSAAAKTVTLTGDFGVESAVKSSPTGMVKATLDTATDELKYTITYSGLSGPVQAAHFHGPAGPGVEAGVLVPIPGPYASGMSHEVKVTPAVAKDLEEGKTYVNLHTAAAPMGEARAQMKPAA
jgi:hypothetical protein